MRLRAELQPEGRGGAVRRLRIAHVSPTFFDSQSVVGGGERYVYNLARSLDAVRETLPISVDQTIFALGKQEKLFLEGSIPVRILPNENPSANLMSGLSGRFWEELASFDLIHVHQSLTVFGAFCAVVAKSLGKHLVMTDLYPSVPHLR